MASSKLKVPPRECYIVGQHRCQKKKVYAKEIIIPQHPHLTNIQLDSSLLEVPAILLCNLELRVRESPEMKSV